MKKIIKGKGKPIVGIIGSFVLKDKIDPILASIPIFCALAVLIFTLLGTTLFLRFINKYFKKYEENEDDE